MAGARSELKLDNRSCASTIVLFGPYVGRFTKDSMEDLVRPISHGPHRDWILDTIAELSIYWDALISESPEDSRAISGPEQLADLDSWLRHGATNMASDITLPRIVVGPLVVLIHLTQY